jgi:FkbM family methyltransferase
MAVTARLTFRGRLKRILRRVLPDALIRAGFRYGYSLAPELREEHARSHFQVASVEWSLRNLGRLGFRPEAIVDVGAYVGDWTRLVKGVFPASRVLMVEGQPSKELALEAAKAEFPGSVDYRVALLSSTAGKEVVFHELEQGSSVYEEKSRFPRQPRTLVTRTLDEVSLAAGFERCDLLKLDVQGHELEVLKGGLRLLRSAPLALLEVSFVQVNVGAPIFHEVVQFMAQQGFVACDICSLARRRRDQVLLQSDLLFLRNDSALLGPATVD